MSETVLIVHCIDTEGPLYEDFHAKFEGLKELYGITHITPSRENLKKLKHADIELGGLEFDVAKMLNSHPSTYNETWDQINNMLNHIMTSEFRNQLPDSYGGSWVYNWHCMDHVGYEYNPRRRDIGYHNIFDHYKHILDQQKECPDAIHWHFHPMSIYRDAH